MELATFMHYPLPICIWNPNIYIYIYIYIIYIIYIVELATFLHSPLPICIWNPIDIAVSPIMAPTKTFWFEPIWQINFLKGYSAIPSHQNPISRWVQILHIFINNVDHDQSASLGKLTDRVLQCLPFLLKYLKCIDQKLRKLEKINTTFFHPIN